MPNKMFLFINLLLWQGNFTKASNKYSGVKLQYFPSKYSGVNKYKVAVPLKLY